ncbi:MAG: YvcK family protein [Planctomycetes bacterium]|nr:YvcK family protein [Planctomycetota bacterium]
MRKGVVTIGGGTGQAATLAALAGVPATAVVGVTDDGGHSGSLRRLLGIPQVGDLRSCLAHLAPAGNPVGDLLRHRFTQGSLEGTATGNLMLAALALERGSLTRAAIELGKGAGVAARVLPVSDASAAVCAELADGKVVKGEWAIIGRRNLSPIVRVFHEPALSATREVLNALRHASAVVICPGSLWTGIGSVLAARGVRAALAKARIVYVANLMTQPGQTDGMDAAAHEAAIARMLGRRPDAVLVNTGLPPAALLRLYARHESAPVLIPAVLPPHWIARDLTEGPSADALRRYARAGRFRRQWPHFIRHDLKKLGRGLRALMR